MQATGTLAMPVLRRSFGFKKKYKNRREKEGKF
jgi:hypothetical protein